MGQREPVLILGGTGQAGAGAAALLRRWHPTLPLTIAGRDPERARRLADELGHATAATVDLRRRDLGLPATTACSAVVAARREHRQHPLRDPPVRGVANHTI
ncbi:hypothetical protein ACFV2A_02255 [Streptomyces californicus]|uniref:hypothetical protein n=1 Tax=Streptomyces californicus TaxID=67351 RepID=UPI0036AC3A99